MKPLDRNWERATWYTGVMAAYKTTRDRQFFDQAMAWGKLHQWQVGTETSGANKLFCVETWAEIYFESREKALIEPAVKWLDTPAPNTPAGATPGAPLNAARFCTSTAVGAPAFAPRVNSEPKLLTSTVNVI